MKRIEIVTALISGMGCQQAESVIQRAYDTADLIIKHNDPDKAKNVEELIDRLAGLKEKVGTLVSEKAELGRQVDQLKQQVMEATRPSTDSELSKRLAAAEAERDQLKSEAVTAAESIVALTEEGVRLRKEVAELSKVQEEDPAATEAGD